MLDKQVLQENKQTTRNNFNGNDSIHRSFAENDYFILFQFPDSLINKSKYACIALFDSKSIWRLNLQQNTDKKRFILLSNLIPYLYHEQRRSFIRKKRLFFFHFSLICNTETISIIFCTINTVYQEYIGDFICNCFLFYSQYKSLPPYIIKIIYIK